MFRVLLLVVYLALGHVAEEGECQERNGRNETCLSSSVWVRVLGGSGAGGVQVNPRAVVSRVGGRLEMSCELRRCTEEELELSWDIPQPRHANASTSSFNDSISIRIERLRESDEGDYVCEAKSSYNSSGLAWTVAVRVIPKSGSCDKMFSCEYHAYCIPKRYVCDGMTDCPNERDEAPSLCGESPCAGKVDCEGRCIPAAWCCEPREPNCTVKVRPSCCLAQTNSPPRLHVDPEVYMYNQQHLTDLTILHTTVYTLIGCSMVFMLITVIVMVAICKVRFQRHMLSPIPLRPRPPDYLQVIPSQMGLGMYELEEVGRGQDSAASLLVTYNINNGVQILGEPPPYSELPAPAAACLPYTDDPPPPYHLQT